MQTLRDGLVPMSPAQDPGDARGVTHPHTLSVPRAMTWRQSRGAIHVAAFKNLLQLQQKPIDTKGLLRTRRYYPLQSLTGRLGLVGYAKKIFLKDTAPATLAGLAPFSEIGSIASGSSVARHQKDEMMPSLPSKDSLPFCLEDKRKLDVYDDKCRLNVLF